MKPNLWFAKRTQQSVMAKAATLPVIFRSGPSAQSGKSAKTKNKDEDVFIVGESQVGGPHRVGGNP